MGRSLGAVERRMGVEGRPRAHFSDADLVRDRVAQHLTGGGRLPVLERYIAREDADES
jgi:hypothetical protein